MVSFFPLAPCDVGVISEAVAVSLVVARDATIVSSSATIVTAFTDGKTVGSVLLTKDDVIFSFINVVTLIVINEIGLVEVVACDAVVIFGPVADSRIVLVVSEREPNDVSVISIVACAIIISVVVFFICCYNKICCSFFN